MRWRSFSVLLLCTSSVFAHQTNRTSGDVEVLHRTLSVDGAPYDAIVTRPATTGPHPAVLLIGGLGCYSLANLQPGEPYYELLNGLSRAGFVTMRVDKNGEGASHGPPCDSPQSDLRLAVRRSVAGLNALAGLDYVDRQKIFIFAHSIGPIEGVLVAQQFPVRGFVAAETIGKSWYEYELENARRQFALVGRAYDEVDRDVRTAADCKYRFLIQKQRPAEVVAAAPQCGDSVRTFGVSYTYFQQIADVNLAAEWKKLDLPVLVTYGTSDPSTSAEENQYLVAIINSFHPGRASYAEFHGMGHGLDMAASPLAWLQSIQKHQHGAFDKVFLERVVAWFESVLQQPSSRAANLREDDH